jgi:site-specific DNA-methyltransferase (adenine-specific)
MIQIDNESHEFETLNDEKLVIYKQRCLDSFPKCKKYQVIYADPPWTYGSAGNSIQNQCNKHYPTMTIDEMSKIPIKDVSDSNCALFLWVSNPQLPKALELINIWGFEFKTVFKVWRKTYSNGDPVCVPGWWSRSSVELLLVASKGSPLKQKTTNNEPQEYVSQRTLLHSEKPDEIRDSVYNFLNVQNRLEVFGRKKVSDWDIWGLEMENFFYEGTGISPIEINGNHRTIGVQCSILNDSSFKMKRIPNSSTTTIKPSGSTIGGMKNHKEDCSCCICKKLRLRKSQAVPTPTS